MTVSMHGIVDRTMAELAGMHAVDQQAALAAAREPHANGLTLSAPELSDAQVHSLCRQLARRVRAQLRRLEAPQMSASVD